MTFGSHRSLRQNSYLSLLSLDFAGFSGGVFGVPKGIRTPDLSLRRRTLYPTELLAHNITIVYDGLRFVKKLGNFLILLNIQKNLK